MFANMLQISISCSFFVVCSSTFHPLLLWMVCFIILSWPLWYLQNWVCAASKVAFVRQPVAEPWWAVYSPAASIIILYLDFQISSCHSMPVSMLHFMRRSWLVRSIQNSGLLLVPVHYKLTTQPNCVITHSHPKLSRKPEQIGPQITCYSQIS